MDEERDDQKAARADRDLHGEERRKRGADSDQGHDAHEEDDLPDDLADRQQAIPQLNYERRRHGGLGADQNRSHAGQHGAQHQHVVVTGDGGERDGAQDRQRREQEPPAEDGPEQPPALGPPRKQ